MQKDTVGGSSRYRLGKPAWLVFLLLGPACTGAIDGADGTGGDSTDSGGDGGHEGSGEGGGGADPQNAGGAAGSDAPACAALPAASPEIVRRLTYTEISNTVRDVLGFDASAEVGALPSDLGGAFSNDAQTLTVGLEQARGFADLAARLTAKVPDFPAFVAKHAACRDATDPCRQGFVRKLGLRLFRRPLSSEEIQRYAGLFAVAAQEGDSFEVGAQLVLRAMLQAPRFVYRIEQQLASEPGWRTVDDFELASRLSFLIWSAGPDDALLAEATAGRLADPELRAQQIDRLLADQRAQRGVLAYAHDWLKLGSLDGVEANPQRYPGFDQTLRSEMRAEALAFFADLWQREAPLGEILTGRQTTAAERVARLQGIAATAGVKRYDLPADRAGVLTLPAFLAVSAHTSTAHSEPSMVMRGLFVLRNVLCQDVPAPPTSVVAQPIVPKAGATQRTAALARGESQTCNGCHGLIDPLAFALEPYDAMGRFRAVDELSNPLRADGELPSPLVPEPAAYTDARTMVDALAQSPLVLACTVQLNLRFALGRALSADDACLTDSIAAALRATAGQSLPDLTRVIALHPSLRLARSE